MLRELQKQRLKDIFNVPGWKILILDDRTQTILSPLLRTNKLREQGITSIFNISKKRYKISDSHAIYFIEPNKKNIQQIISDFQENLYSKSNFHFLKRIDRKLLENLGIEIAKLGKGNFVESVFDEFLDFICLSTDFFYSGLSDTLRLSTGLEKIEIVQNENLKDRIISYKNSVLDSIFSVLFLFNEVPFIEDDFFGRFLYDKIKTMGIIKESVKRSLLIIYDRKMDMITPVEHVWSYNALINELFEFVLGKVQINEEKFDIDFEDEFWIKNQNESIPLVAERIEKLFLEHKKYMALRNITENSTQKEISKVLESAPELAKKNELVNTHMKICVEIIKILNEKKLDEFYRMEKQRKYEEISGSEDDILRCKTVLNIGNDEFNLKIRKYHPPPIIENKIYTHVSTILGSLKKLLPEKTVTPLSQHVESKYNNVCRLEFLNGECYDKSQISKIICFSVGGGTYTEYKSLKELELKLKIPIIYGCDQVLNWKLFKEQVENM